MGEAKTARRPADKRVTVLFIFCGVLFIAVVALIIVFFTSSRSSGGSENTRIISERVIKKVEKLYLAPTNDVPTVAEIKDKKSLTDQEFYKDAENGDFLLVYNKHKIAILYRESINKLVKVAPVIPTDTDSTNQAEEGGQSR